MAQGGLSLFSMAAAAVVVYVTTQVKEKKLLYTFSYKHFTTIKSYNKMKTCCPFIYLLQVENSQRHILHDLTRPSIGSHASMR